MKHFRLQHLPGLWPRTSEHGVVVTVTCGDCEGTGTRGRGPSAYECRPCEGTGEIIVFENETAEVGHA